MTDHHAALIRTMVLVSASDQNMTDSEMAVIGDIVGHLPIFADYDKQRLTRSLADCAALFSQENGLDRGLQAIRDGLPAKLRETAYAVACDVAAADGRSTPEEQRVLELLRQRLEIDPLVATAIERGARARFAVV